MTTSPESKRKTCTKCGEEKELSCFSKHSRTKDGYQHNCKPCCAESSRNYYNPDKHRARSLIYKYGITVEEYDLLFTFQGGCCYVCKKPCPTGRRLAVDHDHQTGQVRGLLCVNCNQRVVGNLTVEQVMRIHEYMLNPPATQVFGKAKFVPEGMEKPRRKKRKRRVSTTRNRRKSVG